MRYWVQLATEQFPPSALVRQAAGAERAGFDGINVSDHFQPWWEPGESAHAWALLGAISGATESAALGTGVTAPVFRHNPATVAQFIATIEELAPGRAFLGIGSGESLNESPCGMDWPSVGEQIARMEEALEIINRLLDGERLDHEGRFFRTKAAYLHTRGERRPPVYVSAFGPEAAAVAGRHGDGVWTMGDAEMAPGVIDAYRGACDDAGREPGEIVLQAGFSWAEDDDAALEGARVWKSTQVDDYFTDDWHDPRAMYESLNSSSEISCSAFSYMALGSCQSSVKYSSTCVDFHTRAPSRAAASSSAQENPAWRMISPGCLPASSHAER